MIINDLKKAGLSDKEAKVYLALLELGEANVSDLAKKSSIKRTTVYLAIDALMEKGMVSTTKRAKKSLYVAESPHKLKDSLEEKKMAIEKAIPELMSIANFLEKKPKIRYFEGKEGIKEVYKDTLRFSDSEILAWFSEPVIFFDKDWFTDFYIPTRLKKKIWVRAIMPDIEKMREFADNDQAHLRKSKFIPGDKLSPQLELSLYGKNKLGIMSYSEELGIIIESEKIYTTLKGIFEVMWEKV